MNALLGRKIGMTRVFDDEGRAVPATVLELGPCDVLQVKTRETDGYAALQLGFEDKKRRRANRPESGHARKAGVEPKYFVREVPVEGEIEHELGGRVTVETMQDVPRVDVIGVTKGRGFAGGIKRWNFSGQGASHGVHRVHRAPGTIGQSATPSRVFKGTHMAGHYGHVRRTVKNLRVVSVDVEQNLMVVRGGVPGPNGGYIVVRRSQKGAQA